MIDISQEYIGIEKSIGRLPMQITHWHPNDEDIFEDILKIGTKGNGFLVNTISSMLNKWGQILVRRANEKVYIFRFFALFRYVQVVFDM